MLKDFSDASHIYIACGYTDMRRGIDGLASIVQQTFKLDPFEDSIFLFCGRKLFLPTKIIQKLPDLHVHE
jgi:transposase